MKEFLDNVFKKEHFWVRLITVILAVTAMGFFMSLLIRVSWGTDPCTRMSQVISKKLGWTIGNWQALFNSALLIIVILFGLQYIGLGTIANMFLVGYSIDFFNWVWSKTLPADFFDPTYVKIITFIPALLGFVIAVAVYVEMKLGIAPYDAVPIIIGERLFPKIEQRWIRMAFDFTAIGIGTILGAKLQIVTFLMALLLGPTIGAVGKVIGKKWNFE